MKITWDPWTIDFEFGESWKHRQEIRILWDDLEISINNNQHVVFKIRKVQRYPIQKSYVMFFEDTFVGGDYFKLTFLLIWFTLEKQFKFALEKDSKYTSDNKIQTSSIPQNLELIFP